MNRKPTNSMRSLRLSTTSKLLVVLLGVYAGHAVGSDDTGEVYEYLYPQTGGAASAQAAPAQSGALPEFGSSGEVRPWTQKQLDDMKEAFKRREPIPDKPSVQEQDQEIRLWDLGDKPSSSAKVETDAAALNTPYDALIHKYAARYGVSPRLIALQMKKESAFNPNAISPTGKHKGLLQISDDLAKEFGVDPYDPESNINVGVLYMSSMLKRYSGNVKLALAAYNAGPANVDKYAGIPPFKETVNYVNTIAAALDI